MSAHVIGRRRQDRMVAWMPVIFMLLLGSLSWWLEVKISKAVVDKHKPTVNTPESFAENYASLRYDAEGALTQELTAVRGSHFPQLNRAVVEKPAFRGQSEQGAPIAVKASKAVVELGVKNHPQRIDFEGGVRAEQPAFGEQPARTFETSRLTVFPDSGELATQAAVKITQADTQIETKGLKANTKSQTVSGQGPARIVLQPKPGAKD
jgi:LPS export ABC transporter protein LptC